MIQDLHGEHIPLSTQSLSCWLLSPWMPIAGHLQKENPMNSLHFRPKRSNHDTAKQSRSSHPSLRILLVRSSHLFLVSTKIMVLFSFSLMISSSRRISLKKKQVRRHAFHHTTNKTKLSKSPALTCLLFRRRCKRRQSVGCCGWH